MSDVAKFFRKWSANCRLYLNYKPIHSHEDMLRFAEDYHKSKTEPLKSCQCKYWCVGQDRLAVNFKCKSL